ncbi:MAG: 4-phosphopantetheinyl transferase family protein [Pedobacter sp.]|nr:MAG: 4-phosphopantetheinyl transferase family protein [Pedobacter sp.]
MIGNDIVDLAKAAKESNWKRKGFLNKVFTLTEQQLIFSCFEPNLIVWQFWSMKEAAYKALSRNSVLLFNPFSFICSLDGMVDYMDHNFNTKTIVDGKRLHTVASNKQQNLEKINSYLGHNTKDYRTQFNLNNFDLELKKDGNGFPELLDKQTGIIYLASVSHHGRYLAVDYLNYC